MRVGIFGGSFDPVHNGHLGVARAAAAALDLDEVLLIPAGRQPFKGGGHAASASDRVAMLQAAVADDPLFRVDGREVAREGPSYTIDTLRELRTERPNDALVLLIGADAAAELADWRDAQSLARYATVAALTRPGVSIPDGPLIDRVVDVPAIDISATTVRRRVANGEDVATLVPAPVARYVAAHRLYVQGV